MRKKLMWEGEMGGDDPKHRNRGVVWSAIKRHACCCPMLKGETQKEPRSPDAGLWRDRPCPCCAARLPILGALALAGPRTRHKVDRRDLPDMAAHSDPCIVCRLTSPTLADRSCPSCESPVEALSLCAATYLEDW
jgi:hypothetical protein